MMPTVLVLGAAGQVGLFAIAGLLEAEREVIAVTRRAQGLTPTEISGLRRSNLASATEWAGNTNSGWLLLSAGPIQLALDLLTAIGDESAAQPERVVATGTTSIAAKKNSADSREREMIGEIEAAVDGIARCCLDRRIPLAILHPTLIYGCGEDQNLTRLYRFIRRFGFVPIARDCGGQRQPIHVEDLARTLVRAVDGELPEPLESPVCGGDSLTYEQMVRLLFKACSRPVRLVRVPVWAHSLVAASARLMSGSEHTTAEMFRRQSLDLVFDDSPARLALGHDPRPFQPTETDFRLPPQIARIQQALI